MRASFDKLTTNPFGLARKHIGDVCLYCLNLLIWGNEQFMPGNNKFRIKVMEYERCWENDGSLRRQCCFLLINYVKNIRFLRNT